MRFTVAILAEKAIDLLNTKPLLYHYADRSVINSTSSSPGDAKLDDVLFLLDNSSGGHPYQGCSARHCIYIASASEVEKGQLPVCEKDRSLVVLPPSVRLGKLKNALQKTFSIYNSWSENLLEIIQQGENWFALVEEGHRILQNPIVIYSKSMRVLAYTANDGPDEPLWVDTVHAGVARVDSERQAADLMRYLAESEQHDLPFRYEGEGMSVPFYSAPVRIGNELYGMVNTLEFRHPITTGFLDLQRAFAAYVSIQMKQSVSADTGSENAPRQLLIDLLGGNITSTEHLETRLIAAGWHPMSIFCLVCFHSALPFLSLEQWRSTCERLGALFPNAICCLTGETAPHICMVVSGSTTIPPQAVLDRTEHFCQMNYMRAGVSETYYNLLDTPRYYWQAEAAIELETGLLCSYESLHFRHMVQQLKRYPFPEDLMLPAVNILKRTDEESGTEYLQTLRELILHTFNQTETASALGIHRTTLVYRIKRMEELTGINMEDGRQMLHAAISLELL